MQLNFIHNFIYRLRLLIISLALLPSFAFSQSKKPGSIDYLKYTNGFNGLVLGADIKQIPDNRLGYLDGDDKMDKDSCFKFIYKDTTVVKLDDVYLNLLALRTYKNRIINIYVFFKKADGYKVLRSFLATYGLFTNKPSDYVDIYNWKSSTVDLSLNYEVPAELGVATFTCNPLMKEVQGAKNNQFLNVLKTVH